MGGDWAGDPQGPDQAAVGADFRLVRAALPAITELQGTENSRPR